MIPDRLPTATGVAPPPAEPLSASVSVSVTATEKASIQEKAKAAGLSVSAWSRKKLTQQGGAGAPPAPDPVARRPPGGQG